MIQIIKDTSPYILLNVIFEDVQVAQVYADMTLEIECEDDELIIETCSFMEYYQLHIIENHEKFVNNCLKLFKS